MGAAFHNVPVPSRHRCGEEERQGEEGEKRRARRLGSGHLGETRDDGMEGEVDGKHLGFEIS